MTTESPMRSSAGRSAWTSPVASNTARRKSAWAVTSATTMRGVTEWNPGGGVVSAGMAEYLTTARGVARPKHGHHPVRKGVARMEGERRRRAPSARLGAASTWAATSACTFRGEAAFGEDVVDQVELVAEDLLQIRTSIGVRPSIKRQVDHGL